MSSEPTTAHSLRGLSRRDPKLLDLITPVPLNIPCSLEKHTQNSIQLSNTVFKLMLDHQSCRTTFTHMSSKDPVPQAAGPMYGAAPTGTTAPARTASSGALSSEASGPLGSGAAAAAVAAAVANGRGALC